MTFTCDCFQIDLMPMINKSGCECLNESDDHPFTQALSSSGGYMESDTDEQVIELSFIYLPEFSIIS